jgi:hypothetical protein
LAVFAPLAAPSSNQVVRKKETYIVAIEKVSLFWISQSNNDSGFHESGSSEELLL